MMELGIQIYVWGKIIAVAIAILVLILVLIVFSVNAYRDYRRSYQPAEKISKEKGIDLYYRVRREPATYVFRLYKKGWYRYKPACKAFTSGTLCSYEQSIMNAYEKKKIYFI